MGLFQLLLAAAALGGHPHQAPWPRASTLRDEAAERFERWRHSLPSPHLPTQLPTLRLPHLPQLPQLPALPSLPFGGARRGVGGGASDGDLRDPLGVVSESVSSGNGWTLVLERDGVRVWRRPVKGSPVDEVRGNALVNAPPKAVVELLRQADEETIRTYNPMYDSGHDLQQFDTNTKVSYGSVRAIFPFKPRDTVTRVAFRELAQLPPHGGTAILQRAVKHPAMPPRSGYIRAEILRGIFLVQPVARQPGMTNFTFTQQVNAGGIVPAWLMNTLVAQDAVTFAKRIGRAATKSGKKKKRRSS